jgi:dCTP deaminase
MISPYWPSQQTGNGGIPYGLSSFGYDIRIGSTFQVFESAGFNEGVIDPKAFDPRLCRGYEVEPYSPMYLPPHSFALGWAMEELHIPRNVLVVCVGKSTYARCGLIVNITPAEPEWQGYLTLELSNTTPFPIKVYACEGIAQLLFFEGEPCTTSYADRRGRYMNQGRSVTFPSVRKR